MSEIDCFRKRLLGLVHCPSPHELVYQNDSHHDVPIYQLLEDTGPRELPDVSGKRGDILVGGGSGESAALKIVVPEAVQWFTTDLVDLSARQAGVLEAYWSLSDGYVFGAGYVKLGWHVREDLPTWLAAHVVAFLIASQDEFQAMAGPSRDLLESGTICRAPSVEDRRTWGDSLL